MSTPVTFTCPCCGYKTLDEAPPGTFATCLICFWEDDNIQFKDPDHSGGANRPSLRQAQANFRRIGACDEQAMAFVRSPSPADERDVSWKPL